jgi:predicted MPP superfamily phosphohydrolase
MPRKRYRDLPQRFMAHMRWRDVLRCLVLWCVLTAAGTYEGFTFTRLPPERVSISRQRVHNTLEGVLLHGRILSKITRERIYPISDLGTPFVMHAFGWGTYVSAAWLYFTVRRGLLKRWKARVARASDSSRASSHAMHDHSYALASPSVEVSSQMIAVAPTQSESSEDDRLTARTVSRRRLLMDAAVSAGFVAGVALAADAYAIEPFSIQLRTYRVPIADLPASLRGLRLVQVSDTHVGSRVPAQFVQRVCERVAAMKPDVVLLTGDYVHSGELHVAASLASMRSLYDLRVPTVAVLGNHDWYGGDLALRKEFAQYNIPLIDNDRLFLDANTRTLLANRTGESLCIAGVGDYLEDRIDPVRALRDCPPDTPRLLLSHNPDVAEDPILLASRLRVDLMISGHTHGGQVRLPLLGTPIVPSRFGSRYAGGFVKGPAFPVIISRGIGMSLLPVRWNVAPEIVEIELVGV